MECSIVFCWQLFLFPVSKKDHEYNATRLHFENLVKRYGNPIIVLSLIKVGFFALTDGPLVVVSCWSRYVSEFTFVSLTSLVVIIYGSKTREKKPRESILRAEFANAIAFINKDLTEENRLKFRHWDLSKYSKRYTCFFLQISKLWKQYYQYHCVNDTWFFFQ